MQDNEIKTEAPNFEDVAKKLASGEYIHENGKLERPENFGAWYEADYDGD